MTAFSGLALVISRWLATKDRASKAFGGTSITHLADGGYHNVFLLNFPPEIEGTVYNGITITLPAGRRQAVLRIRRKDRSDSLAPLQIRNEVGIRKYLAAHTKVPTPEIYAWNDGTDGCEAFILEEYIEGKSLDEAWQYYTEEEQQSITEQLAKILVDLAETRFDKIGGLDPVDLSYAPNAEYGKHRDGRDKLHDTGCYNVGPYSSRYEYVAGMLDKEIAFAMDPFEDDDDKEWASSDSGKQTLATFQKFVSARGCHDMVDYLRSLREKMLQVVADEFDADCETNSDEEPEPKPKTKPVFTIVHGDIAGRNIMMQGATIAAVIDWEWASILPISQFWTNGGADRVGVELPGYPYSCNGRIPTDEEQEVIELHWANVYQTERNLMKLIEDEANGRKFAGNEYWQNGELIPLMSPEDKVIDVARDCMDVISIQRLRIKLDVLPNNETCGHDGSESIHDHHVLSDDETCSHNGSDSVDDHPILTDDETCSHKGPESLRQLRPTRRWSI